MTLTPADFDLSFRPTYWDNVLDPSDRSVVQIARVAVQSFTGNVFGLYAVPDGDQIRYEMGDDENDEAEFSFEPSTSTEPLTLGEVVALLDGAQEDEWAGVRAPGLPVGFWEAGLEYGEDSPEKASRGAVAESEVYPVLQDYYRARAQEWAAEKSAS